MKKKIQHDLTIELWGVIFPYDKKGKFDPDAKKVAKVLTPIFIKLFTKYEKEKEKV